MHVMYIFSCLKSREYRIFFFAFRVAIVEQWASFYVVLISAIVHNKGKKFYRNYMYIVPSMWKTSIV